MKLWFSMLALSGILVVPRVGLMAQSQSTINGSTASALTEIAFKPLNGVTACDWSPFGGKIAAASADGVFMVDLMFTDSPPVALPGTFSSAIDLAYTPDGNDLVVASPNQIQVWDIEHGYRRLRLDGTGPIAVSHDSSLLAYTDGGTRIMTVHLGDNTPGTVMEGHEDRVTDVGFAPTGQYLASSSLDNTLRLWDVETGDQMRFQRSRSRPQLALDVNLYSSTVASGTRGGIVRLLNVAITTEGQHTLRPRADVIDIEYTPDGLLLAMAGDHTLYLWTMDNHVQPVTYTLSAPLSCLAFNSDASRLLVGTADGLHIFAPAG